MLKNKRERESILTNIFHLSHVTKFAPTWRVLDISHPIPNHRPNMFHYSNNAPSSMNINTHTRKAVKNQYLQEISSNTSRACYLA